MFSLPENLGVVAALQRCPTPRLFAGIRLCGLIVSFFPNFSSQIHYRAGVKSFLASHKCLDGRLRSKLCW